MGTSNNLIPIVSSNQEKWASYSQNFQRYNRAKKSEFYLECLWILYAMLEDRTSSFLFYLGFTSNKKRSSVTGSKEIKKEVRDILKMVDSKEKYRFDSMYGKCERIQQLLLWSNTEVNADTSYKEAVLCALSPLAERKELNEALDYLNGEWRDKRNQLTHALFIKNPNAVVFELKPLVESGYKAVRVIDAAVREIKKKDIRSKFKIQ